MNTIAQALYDTTRPRSKSEYEARFEYWKKPASQTEEQKIESTVRQIKQALDKCLWLGNRYIIIPQGSYRNNTNVRNDSDVDICVCLPNTILEVPALGEQLPAAALRRPVASFSSIEYRLHVTKALQDYFGKDAIKSDGNKAITIHANKPDKISADVVTAYRAHWYQTKSMWINSRPTLYASGIGFHTLTGDTIYNFPEQHYQNGVYKNDETSHRFKKVVRILKRLRNHMKDNGIRNINIASSLIESLVYNCPAHVFAAESLYENVYAALYYLGFTLHDDKAWVNLIEVNGLKLLFHPSQAWTIEQTKHFVNCSYQYIGF